MKIFTFWEPGEKLPGYIRACMRTWEKYLPEAEIVVLDFKNLGEYLPRAVIDSVTLLGRKRMSLAKQADIYRALVLERHGGVWMDADTVLTPAVAASEIFEQHTEVSMFEQKDGCSRYLPGAFIRAVPGAKMIRLWAEELHRRIDRYRKCSGLFGRVLHRGEWRKCRAWHFFLNGVIDSLPDQLSAEEFSGIDMDEAKALLHNFRKRPEGMDEYDNYQDYYFTPGDPEPEKAAKGLIMLQNSWTPERFRAMSEEEFLSQDVRLAKMLRQLI